MEKEAEKVDFDMSALTLQELVKVYGDITDFLQFLDDKKIVVEEKVENE